MSIYDHKLQGLDGSDLDLHDFEDKALLIVNVASKCGLTPQYAGLEQLHEAVRGPGLLGPRRAVQPVPRARSPARPRRSPTFCSTTYGVTFPLAEKVEVNGDGQHPLYAELTAVADGERQGRATSVELREVPRRARRRAVTRFRPQVEPEDPALVGRHRGCPARLSDPSPMRAG